MKTLRICLLAVVALGVLGLVALMFFERPILGVYHGFRLHHASAPGDLEEVGHAAFFFGVVGNFHPAAPADVHDALRRIGPPPPDADLRAASGAVQAFQMLARTDPKAAADVFPIVLAWADSQPPMNRWLFLDSVEGLSRAGVLSSRDFALFIDRRLAEGSAGFAGDWDKPCESSVSCNLPESVTLTFVPGSVTMLSDGAEVAHLGDFAGAEWHPRTVTVDGPTTNTSAGWLELRWPCEDPAGCPAKLSEQRSIDDPEIAFAFTVAAVESSSGATLATRRFVHVLRQRVPPDLVQRVKEARARLAAAISATAEQR